MVLRLKRPVKRAILGLNLNGFWRHLQADNLIRTRMLQIDDSLLPGQPSTTLPYQYSATMFRPKMLPMRLTTECAIHRYLP